MDQQKVLKEELERVFNRTFSEKHVRAEQLISALAQAAMDTFNRICPGCNQVHKPCACLAVD